MKGLLDIILEHIMVHMKVELEVEKEFLSLQKMDHFIKEHGRTITCGAMVD